MYHRNEKINVLTDERRDKRYEDVKLHTERKKRERVRRERTDRDKVD